MSNLKSNIKAARKEKTFRYKNYLIKYYTPIEKNFSIFFDSKCGKFFDNLSYLKNGENLIFFDGFQKLSEIKDFIKNAKIEKRK